MAIRVTKEDVWAATIKDQVGGVADKMAALAAAGVNLQFMIGRRTPDKPGRGVVFVTPIKGARQVRAAKAAGFKRADGLHSVAVETADRRGLVARITRQLAEAGINLRGISAAAMTKTATIHLAFDTTRDATAAIKAIKAM